MKRVLLYLDTNKLANPFDLLLALDAGFDAVLPYESITEENVDTIIHNAVFARGSEGARSTVVLLGGDLESAEKVFQKLRRLMRLPFQMPAIFDPSGACTTSAAIVAKIEKMAGGVRGKKVTILAGTGPIGQISAVMFMNLGAQVTITSRTKEKAAKIAGKLSDNIRGKVIGVQGVTPNERCEACEGADIILATGTLGAQLMDSETLKKLKPSVVADVNAVQPYGIEDVKPDMDGDSVNGAKGLGAFAIGVLKNKTEKELLKRALGEAKFYDYNDALAIARELIK